MSTTTASAFSDELYARTFVQKAKRALQLGWRYYTWDLPRYMLHRCMMRLNPFDLQAAVNPLLEFGTPDEKHVRLPHGYDEALRRLSDCGIQLTLPPHRVAALTAMWERASASEGDVIECGSYRGATSLLLALLGMLQGRRQKVLLFDTFCGTPPACRHDSLRHKTEYLLPIGYTDTLLQQASLLGVDDRVEIHAGVFDEVFVPLTQRPLLFCFGHIDANLYVSTLDACAFVIPRITPGGIVVFDDYNGPCDLGARLAVDRYFRNRPERPCRLAGHSAWFTPAQPRFTPSPNGIILHNVPR